MSTFLNARAQKVEWSNVRNEDLKYDYVRVLGADEEGYYVLKSNLPFEYKKDHYGFKNRKYALAYFDNLMNLKMQRQLTPQKDQHLLNVLFINGQVVLITDAINKETQQYIFHAQWLNNKGIALKPPVKIASLKYSNKSDLDDVSIIASKDQNLICLTYPVNEASKEKQTFHVSVLDTSLQHVWTKDISISHDKRFYEHQHLLLSNEADIYMLGSISGASGQNRYVVLLYDHKKNEQTELPVEGIENISDMNFAFDHLNKKLIIGGLYSDRSDILSGTFYAGIDISKPASVNLSKQPFDNLNDPALNLTRTNNPKSNYSINRMVLRNDGGLVIFAESHYITQTSYYDYFTRTFITKWLYHYDNIIIFSINPDGSLDWQQTINKDQESQEDGGYYSSYCTLIYGNKMNILYNNAISQGSTVLNHSITNKGTRDHKILISESDRVLLIPKGALQVDENTVIIPALRDRNFCYAKITF